jgi:hypothetical protein
VESPPNRSSGFAVAEREPAGLAHVATVSFLASRASPTAGFWIALAGGVALARAASRHGARLGYGASLAAMLETIAIMGPPRLGVPLTQALSAPLLGHLYARGTSLPGQILACAAIRLAQTSLFVAFFILVLAGGLEAYAETYDVFLRWLSLPEGTRVTLILTGATLLAWAAFASTVQVLVYRRGLRAWPDRAAEAGRDAMATGRADHGDAMATGLADHVKRGFDPRAVVIAAAIAFTLLISSTAWTLLALVSAWLALAWASSHPDTGAVPAGLVIAAILGAGVFAFAVVGGAGAELAARRAARVVLLVLVATWLRAAAGSTGLREVSRRTLGRLRRLPSVPEAAAVLDQLGSERQLGSAARSAIARLRPVEKQPIPILDAILAWVVAESARFRSGGTAPAVRLSARARDVVLVALAAAPAIVLVS